MASKRVPNLDNFTGLPDKALLSALDVSRILGYKASFIPKYIPKPIIIPAGDRGSMSTFSIKSRRDRKFWTLGSLRTYKKELEHEKEKRK